LLVSRINVTDFYFGKLEKFLEQKQRNSKQISEDLEGGSDEGSSPRN